MNQRRGRVDVDVVALGDDLGELLGTLDVFAAGAAAIGAGGPARLADELGADATIDSLAELIPVLEALG